MGGDETLGSTSFRVERGRYGSAPGTITLLMPNGPPMPGTTLAGTVTFRPDAEARRRKARLTQVRLRCREFPTTPWPRMTEGIQLFAADLVLEQETGSFEQPIPPEVGVPGYRIVGNVPDQVVLRRWYLDLSVEFDDGEPWSTHDGLWIPLEKWGPAATTVISPWSESSPSHKREIVLGIVLRAVLVCAIAGALVWALLNGPIVFLLLGVPGALVLQQVGRGLRTPRQLTKDAMKGPGTPPPVA